MWELTTSRKTGLVHNVSHGGTNGTVSIVNYQFHQLGPMRSTLVSAVKAVAVVVSSWEKYMDIAKLVKTCGFLKLRVMR